MWKLSFMLLVLAAPEQQSCPVEVTDISWRGSTWYGNYYQPQGAFSAKIKNNSGKTVVEVVWHYVLVDTVRGNIEYDRFKFVTSDKKIKSGQTTKFTKRFDYHDPPDYVAGHVEIIAVKFEDGSVWVKRD